MENKNELIDEITKSLKEDSISRINDIKYRECTSDNYDGISINVTGYIVQIRPIVETVAKFDEGRIENIGMYGDIPKDEYEDGYGVTMFCAYCGEEYDNNIFT